MGVGLGVPSRSTLIHTSSSRGNKIQENWVIYSSVKTRERVWFCSLAPGLFRLLCCWWVKLGRNGSLCTAVLKKQNKQSKSIFCYPSGSISYLWKRFFAKIKQYRWAQNKWDDRNSLPGASKCFTLSRQFPAHTILFLGTVPIFCFFLAYVTLKNAIKLRHFIHANEC